MPGITRSRIGNLSGNEIVQVEYDPAQTSLPALIRALKNENSFYSVIVKDETERDHAAKSLPRSDLKIDRSEPQFVESKYSLRSQHPELYYLNLTETQAVALNSWSYFGGRMPDVLTPEHKELLPRIKTALSRKSPAGLLPARSGMDLELYRTQLLRWLQE